MRLDRRDRVGLVVAFLVAAVCVRLGVWQLDRLHQRRERNATLLAARARPPLEVTGSVSGDSARDRRLQARGVYDYEHERLWRARSFVGGPGVDLVTPLRLADGSAGLDVRGPGPLPCRQRSGPRRAQGAARAGVLAHRHLAPPNTSG